jgi:anthranilate synthase/aminodeoxychorismate synthase-like glutamine amidotransferase
MIIVIDNYDSFTYNLVQFVGELGAEPVVFRNDAITPAQIRERRPRGIIISPGPGTPYDAGVSMDVIRQLSGEIPILGVCLGHQALGAAFGGKVGRTVPLHGKSSLVRHDGSALFARVSNPFRAGRYHSLVVEPERLPDELVVTARTENSTRNGTGNGIVMALRHREHATYGVQFHPESILTEDGKVLLLNFLKLSGEVAS